MPRRPRAPPPPWPRAPPPPALSSPLLRRSPGSGHYSNLQEYDVPYPEAIFELPFFFHNPKPFFALAKKLYPGHYRPNVIHYFLRLLHDKGLLLRLYTQNIDGLERGEPGRGGPLPGHRATPSCLTAVSTAGLGAAGGPVCWHPRQAECWPELTWTSGASGCANLT